MKKFRDQIEELFEIATQEFPDKETEQSKITCDNQISSFEITFSKVSVPMYLAYRNAIWNQSVL